jgi:hypothetical protein
VQGTFGTLEVDETFGANSLKAKEKGLLHVEQPNAVWGKIPFCSEKGSYFEHLFAFLKVLEGLIETKNDFNPDISAPQKTRLSTRKKKLTR